MYSVRAHERIRTCAVCGCLFTSSGTYRTRFQVDHPERYGFNPKQLLNHLTDIYLHLRGDVLARAIATDERSYRKELFVTCTDLLRNKNIKSEVATRIEYID